VARPSIAEGFPGNAGGDFPVLPIPLLQVEIEPNIEATKKAATRAKSDAPRHPAAIPISAVAAGLAPDRAGGAIAGSEVALDALLEERVARQASEFFSQGKKA
jgi:hypothetical protein